MKKQKQECAFCTKVINEDRCIVENSLAWAFPTNIPITTGHILVVPKRCATSFFDLSTDEKLAVFELQNKIVEALKTTKNHFLSRGI